MLCVTEQVGAIHNRSVLKRGEQAIVDGQKRLNQAGKFHKDFASPLLELWRPPFTGNRLNLQFVGHRFSLYPGLKPLVETVRLDREATKAG
jgi:hypothetical protein